MEGVFRLSYSTPLATPHSCHNCLVPILTMFRLVLADKTRIISRIKKGFRPIQELSHFHYLSILPPPLHHPPFQSVSLSRTSMAAVWPQSAQNHRTTELFMFCLSPDLSGILIFSRSPLRSADEYATNTK